ncbi:hypothetical protein B0H19DRAFT_1261886 [Mycena capillaripes]|nr:hypothetical protein B0H19DRAFT_1261886 [Mycena capillaripes]
MDESIGSQFFAIQELLLLVLSYFAPPGKGTISSIDTHTLAQLACVSRNISNAALDALWRSIYQPAAIVRLLPGDSYAAGETQYTLRRPLSEDDFGAFDKYAARIHYVDFSNSSKILGPGCELFAHIKGFRDPILPALADFRWEPSAYNGSIGAFHLLSREASIPSQEFSLLMWSEIEHRPDEQDIIADTINDFNDPTLPWLPDVKKLTLRTLHYLPAVQTAIRRLSYLEHFSCDLRVSAALFERLAVLPRLRFIDLRWLPVVATSNVPPDSQSFPSLEGLRISGTLSSISALLPLISSPDLLSVGLIVKDLDFQSIQPSLISLLLPPSVPTRTSTLLYFSFTASNNNRGSGHLRLELAAFAPLYVCSALQTFRVDVDPAQLVLTDADVRAMARAWPSLTVLTVPPPRTTPRPTPDVHLHTLWALATACPQLQQLALEVDADVSEPFRAGDGGSGHTVIMEELTLFCSPCGDPMLVAEFLNLAFPRLPARAFHAYSTNERPEDRAKWAVVVDALIFAEA